MHCYFKQHWKLKLVFSLVCRQILRFLIVLLVFRYILRVYHQKMLVFFALINFNVLYFAFLYNSLSMWSLDFLNLLKNLSLELTFSKTSPSNHFWVFALTHLVLQGAILSTTICQQLVNNYCQQLFVNNNLVLQRAILSTTILIFWKKFECASLTSVNSS